MIPPGAVYIFKIIRVTVKAIAADGYKFDGWSGAVTSNEDSITLTVNPHNKFICILLNR